MVASDRIGSVEITVFEDDIIEVVVREKAGGWSYFIGLSCLCCTLHYFCRRFCKASDKMT